MLSYRLMLAAGIACAAAGVVAAESEVKLGLWEQTITTKDDAHGKSLRGNSKGQSSLPLDMRAAIAKQESTQSKSMGGTRTVIKRACVTAESLPKWENFTEAEGDEGRCERKLSEQTPQHIKITMVCENGHATEVAEFNVQAPDRITGAIKTVIVNGDKERNLQTDLTAKWIAADCGVIPPGRSRRAPRS